jgi:molybdopterin-biosynthesis enzyme MoeA-like protein
MMINTICSICNPRAKVMQEAVANFIRKKFPTDLGSVIRYDHRTIVKTPPLPNEFDLLMEHEVNGISKMGGGTKTIAALDKAIDELKE